MARFNKTSGLAALGLLATALVVGCGDGGFSPLDVQPVCGDGVVEGSEQCDDGNYDNADYCLATCRIASCGDGYLEAGVEECDDGNNRGGDACEPDCTVGSSTGCGNGTVEPGEECDDGNTQNSDACLADCTVATCGDGFAQLGVEDCDDGNTDDADGCGSDCKLTGAASGTCPGLELPLTAGNQTNLVGDTATATDTVEGSCGGAGSPDIVYAVTPKSDGWLTATLTGINGGDPVLMVRQGGCDVGQELACEDSTGSNGTEQTSLEVTGGVTYWVFIDSSTAASTQFALNLELNDGVPGDTCPGTTVPLSAGDVVTLEGDTSQATSAYKGESYCGGSFQTKELVYSVTPSSAGLLTVTLSPTYDGVLYARVGSCSGGMQVACSDANWNAGGPEQVQINAVANTKYSVFVDGYQGDAGAYEVTFSLQN